jgi:hypothetical protein
MSIINNNKSNNCNDQNRNNATASQSGRLSQSTRSNSGSIKFGNFTSEETTNKIANDLLTQYSASNGSVSRNLESASYNGSNSYHLNLNQSNSFANSNAQYEATGQSAMGSNNAGGPPVLSQVEQQILQSSVPIDVNGNEEISVEFKGSTERGIWANKSEIVNWQGTIPIEQYVINQDLNPEVITKKTEQALVYIQELAIRYLRPPTPPPPGEIIIKQDGSSNVPPAPPLVIRQIPARACTPEPLVIREAPPQPPPAIGRKVITIGGNRIPPPPRKVIIERLAPLPSKPQSVLVERWLPYAQVKRRVIFQRQQEADAVVIKPRNVVVQWEAPRVEIKKEFKYLGVIRANPVEYVQRYGTDLKQSHQLPQFVLDIKTPEGLVLAADYKYSNVYELEGDVKALQLINLQEEGLGEYSQLLAKYGLSYVGEAGVKAKLDELNLAKSLSLGRVSSTGFTGVSGSVNNNGGSAFASGSASASASAGYATSASGIGGYSYGAVRTASSGAFGRLSAAQSNYAPPPASEATIEAIFKQIDRDNSGEISVDEAGAVLLRLNSQLNRGYGENEIKTFFDSLDTNRNGELSFDEFKAAFKALLG